MVEIIRKQFTCLIHGFAVDIIATITVRISSTSNVYDPCSEHLYDLNYSIQKYIGIAVTLGAYVIIFIISNVLYQGNIIVILGNFKLEKGYKWTFQTPNIRASKLEKCYHGCRCESNMTRRHRLTANCLCARFSQLLCATQ